MASESHHGEVKEENLLGGEKSAQYPGAVAVVALHGITAYRHFAVVSPAFLGRSHGGCG